MLLVVQLNVLFAVCCFGVECFLLVGRCLFFLCVERYVLCVVHCVVDVVCFVLSVVCG